MNEKAKQTIRTVEQGMQKGQTACMPELVRIINTLSMNIQDLPIYQLSEMIQNDPIILQKVIDASNKIGYNPLNIPVDSLASAIQVVGFDRVRSLTMSMILLENAHKEQYSPERQKAALHALTAGLLSQRLAEHVTQHIDRDRAFVCGALRGYGAILLATYLPTETETVEKHSTHKTRERKYTEEFGLTQLELSRYIISKSDMPLTILTGLDHFNSKAPNENLSERLSTEDLIIGVSEFGHQLAEIALDPEISQNEFTSTIQSLAVKFGKVLKRDFEFYSEQLQHTYEYIGKLRFNTASSSFPQNGYNCLKARYLNQEPPKPNQGEQDQPDDPFGFPSHDAPAIQNLAGTPDYWAETCEKICAIETKSGLSKSTIDTLFGIMAKGFAPDEIWLFLPNESSRQKFKLTYNVGTHEMLLGNKTTIQTREDSIFGLCLRRREILVIRDAQQKQIIPHLPSWYRENVNLNSFVLCSIHENERPAGLVYIGWKAATNFQIQPELAPYLRKILAKIAKLSTR